MDLNILPEHNASSSFLRPQKGQMTTLATSIILSGGINERNLFIRLKWFYVRCDEQLFLLFTIAETLVETGEVEGGNAEA